jgi:hypothetical protein
MAICPLISTVVAHRPYHLAGESLKVFRGSGELIWIWVWNTAVFAGEADHDATVGCCRSGRVDILGHRFHCC